MRQHWDTLNKGIGLSICLIETHSFKATKVLAPSWKGPLLLASLGHSLYILVKSINTNSPQFACCDRMCNMLFACNLLLFPWIRTDWLLFPSISCLTEFCALHRSTPSCPTWTGPPVSHMNLTLIGFAPSHQSLWTVCPLFPEHYSTSFLLSHLSGLQSSTVTTRETWLTVLTNASSLCHTTL